MRQASAQHRTGQRHNSRDRKPQKMPARGQPPRGVHFVKEMAGTSKTHSGCATRKQAASERGSLTLRQACSLEKPGSAMCVQNFDDSRGLAIRITYRISLRPSSLWEPRHPLLKVVKWFGNSNPGATSQGRPRRPQEGSLLGYSLGQSETGHTIR